MNEEMLLIVAKKFAARIERSCCFSRRLCCFSLITIAFQALPTRDVDMIVDASNRAAFTIEESLRTAGFRQVLEMNRLSFAVGVNL